MTTGVVPIADAMIAAGAAMASSGAMAVATARRAAILPRRRNRAADVIATTIVAEMTVADGTIAVDATMARRRCLAGNNSLNRLALRLRRSSNRRVAVVRSLTADRGRGMATGVAVAIAGVTILHRRCSAVRAPRRRKQRLLRSNNAGRVAGKARGRAMTAGVAVTMIAGAMTTVATTVGVTAKAAATRTEAA